MNDVIVEYLLERATNGQLKVWAKQVANKTGDDPKQNNVDWRDNASIRSFLWKHSDEIKAIVSSN